MARRQSGASPVIRQPQSKTFFDPFAKNKQAKKQVRPKKLTRNGVWVVTLVDLKIHYNVYRGVVHFHPLTPQKWIDRHVWVRWSKVAAYWRDRGADIKRDPDIPPF